jgi:hypothetical protein
VFCGFFGIISGRESASKAGTKKGGWERRFASYIVPDLGSILAPAASAGRLKANHIAAA